MVIRGHIKQKFAKTNLSIGVKEQYDCPQIRNTKEK